MNIYPREVEEALLRHPGVRATAVVGRPDSEWGEAVVAFIVAVDGVAAPGVEDLDRTCLESIARFKRPKEYRFVETLPTNNYGKVLKRELRDQLRTDVARQSRPDTRTRAGRLAERLLVGAKNPTGSEGDGDVCANADDAGKVECGVHRFGEASSED